MTTTRSLTLALAAAAAVAAAGCGDQTKCNDATPPVKAVPTTCVAVVGQALTVPINTCPKCDQGTPTCDVRQSQDLSRFTVEPVSQVCDPNSSCPIPDIPSCPAAPAGCVLTGAMTATLNPASTYFIDIVTDTGAVTRSLTVASSGTAECTGMASP